MLRTVRLSGALFFLYEASSPWATAVPRAEHFSSIILPGVRHVISYHIVTEGSGWVQGPAGPPARFAAGDVLVFPHGDAYAMMSAPTLPPDQGVADGLAFFRAMAAGELPFVVAEGGGGPDRTKLVCGFLGCDARPFNPLLATLPPMIQLRRPAGAGEDLLDRLIGLTLAEATAERAGGHCIRLRLSELIFVELVRRYLAALPPDQSGWLAGLRDPGVGRVLALLHERPNHAWTIDELAREAGLSRSVLAERFVHFVGQPPMHYLTGWRMQLAARMLADGAPKIGAVGRDVGYASEAAFSRAFKKATGVAPAAWRKS